MKRIQLIGLALIVLAGASSQFLDISGKSWVIWVPAVAAVVGMILILVDWIKSEKE